MNTVIITCLILVLVILVIVRRRISGYTKEQIDMIPQNLPIVGGNSDIQKYTIKIIRNQLENINPLANVNALVNIFNQSISDQAKKLTPYTKIEDFDNLISSVYTSSETSSTNDRDRIILRAICWPTMSLLNLGTVLDPYTAPDGKADFTDTILSETGKSIEEIFKFGYALLDMLFDRNTNGFTPESIDYVNSYIPSKYDPPFLRTNSDAVMTAMMNKTDRGKFLAKLLSIGSIYIKWMIENKWKLDLTWRPSICDPIIEVPTGTIMFLPSKINKGPGTYTKAELGNPTSFVPHGFVNFEFKNDTIITMSSGNVNKWDLEKTCIMTNTILTIDPTITWSSVTINPSSGTSS